jgi:hypothetical protein
MITNTWTDAPAGLPAEGLVVRPRCERRAPEAFTTPYQGTGLPFGSAVVDTVFTEPTMQRPAIGLTTSDNVHIGTTLGIHSSRRPPG